MHKAPPIQLTLSPRDNSLAEDLAAKKKSPDSVSPENITEKMRLQVFPETRSERPVARRESDFGSGRKTYFQSSRIGALISARKNQRIAPSRVLSTSSLRTMGISDGV